MVGYVIAAALIAHFLSDFYLQSDELAERKRRDGRALATHCFIYAVTAGVCIFLLTWGWGALGIALAMALTHAIIDCIKCHKGKKASCTPLRMFCVDQMAHLIAIVLIVAILSDYTSLSPLVCEAASLLGGHTFGQAAALTLALIAIGKPTEIFVSLILANADLSDAKSEEKEEAVPGSVLQAGRWIGILERVIVAVMTLWGEFGAIAFVLTAKSIARFDMLKNQQFAERYLIGTLASAATAILAALLAQGLVGLT